MHHSQSNSRPSLQGGGKSSGSHAGTSILASVDGKAGRQRAAAGKQAAAASASGQRRVWVWALPLMVLGAVAGTVFWMQGPVGLLASARPAADRSAAPAVSVADADADADADAVNTPMHVVQQSTPTSEPSAAQLQGAYIEDAGVMKGEASPFAALQAKANAAAEIGSPFQALNATKPAEERAAAQIPSVPHAAQTHARGRVPTSSLAKSVQPPAVAAATVQASASVAEPASLARTSTVMARAESVAKRVAPSALPESKGATAMASAVASAPAVVPARTQAESPAVASTVAVTKPALTTIAASAAQAAASAAIAEAPAALSSRDPVDGLLKAAGQAAAAVATQGVSRLTHAQAPQQTSAPILPSTQTMQTVPSAPNTPAESSKPVAAEKAPAQDRLAESGLAENAPTKNGKPNNKPEKAKTPDPDVTLMRALMRHIETTSK